MQYLVHIVETKSGKIVKSIDCGGSERKQSSVMIGASINLDHNNYRIDTEDKE